MATEVSFWTQLKLQAKLFNVAEEYLSPLSRNAKFVIVRPNFGIEVYDSTPSRLTVPKVIAYATSVIPYLAYGLDRLSLKKAIAFSLVVPAGAFVLKIVNQMFFHYLTTIVTRPTKEQWIGFDPVAERRLCGLPPKILLVMNQIYRLLPEEVAALKIPFHRLNHNLPQGNNSIYSIPAVSYRLTSDLPQYQDSYFDLEFKGRYNPQNDRMEDLYYEVVRRSKDAPLLDFNKYHNLSTDEVVDLALVPIDEKSATSLRPEYVGSIFSCEKAMYGYSITRQECKEAYTKIPFNHGFQLTELEIIELQLTYQGESKDLVKGETWNYRISDIPEYKNSVFLVKEGKRTCTVVRMLTPKK